MLSTFSFSFCHRLERRVKYTHAVNLPAYWVPFSAFCKRQLGPAFSVRWKCPQVIFLKHGGGLARFQSKCCSWSNRGSSSSFRELPWVHVVYKVHHRGPTLLWTGIWLQDSKRVPSPASDFSNLEKQMSLFLQEAFLNHSSNKVENFLMLICIKILNLKFHLPLWNNYFIFWVIILWSGIWSFKHLLFVGPWIRCLNSVPQFPYIANEATNCTYFIT